MSDWPDDPRATKRCRECGTLTPVEELLDDPTGPSCAACVEQRVRRQPWTLSDTDRRLLRSLRITQD
jgi:hypothetical protein